MKIYCPECKSNDDIITHIEFDDEVECICLKCNIQWITYAKTGKISEIYKSCLK